MAKPRVREYSGKVICNPFYQRRRVSSLQSKKADADITDPCPYRLFLLRLPQREGFRFLKVYVLFFQNFS